MLEERGPISVIIKHIVALVQQVGTEVGLEATMAPTKMVTLVLEEEGGALIFVLGVLLYQTGLLLLEAEVAEVVAPPGEMGVGVQEQLLLETVVVEVRYMVKEELRLLVVMGLVLLGRDS